MACKGFCEKIRGFKPANKQGRYESGQKRCQTCDIFINWEGLWCPCCGYRLRATPRSKIYKEKFLKSKSVT